MSLSPRAYDRYLERTGKRSINRVLYRCVRTIDAVITKVFFQATVEGREYIPTSGPVIVAPVHRSFWDTFFVGLHIPFAVNFAAKQELFRRGRIWFLVRMGAFPVNRGSRDGRVVDTIVKLIELGDSVMAFPEGTRYTGGLGEFKTGVAEAALRTGATIIPVGVIGTHQVWHPFFLPRWRPWRRRLKVRIKFGPPITCEKRVNPTRQECRELTAIVESADRQLWLDIGGSSEPGVKVNKKQIETIKEKQ